MTKEHLTIMYVGEGDGGLALQRAVESLGWHVYTSTELMQALGRYVFDYPDLVILDVEPNSNLAEEVYFHLSPVNTKPLFILTDETRRGQWHTLVMSPLRVLSRPIGADELLTAIFELTEQQELISV